MTFNGFTNDIKFKDDSQVYEQISRIPNSDDTETIGLINKGTPINIQDDGRFYITITKDGK